MPNQFFESLQEQEKNWLAETMEGKILYTDRAVRSGRCLTALQIVPQSDPIIYILITVDYADLVANPHSPQIINMSGSYPTVQEVLDMLRKPENQGFKPLEEFSTQGDRYDWVTEIVKAYRIARSTIYNKWFPNLRARINAGEEV